VLGKLLQERYPLPEWALVFELNKGVGAYGTDRRADAVAFNCYPSKKLVRHAFEFKTDRGDFIRELNNPKKREWLESNFHETYFVTPHKLVKEKEVPEGWGLLVATSKGDTLRRTVIARHRDVPAMPEKIALSAIRSLASSLSNLNLPYVLDGREVKKEEVQEYVDEVLKHQHETLRKRLNAVEKERLALSDLRGKLIGPFRELRRAIGGFSWLEDQQFADNPEEVITTDNVIKWLREVEKAKVIQLLKPIISARDALSELIDSVKQ
jgi:hypothetical protein